MRALIKRPRTLLGRALEPHLQQLYRWFPREQMSREQINAIDSLLLAMQNELRRQKPSEVSRGDPMTPDPESSRAAVTGKRLTYAGLTA